MIIEKPANQQRHYAEEAAAILGVPAEQVSIAVGSEQITVHLCQINIALVNQSYTDRNGVVRRRNVKSTICQETGDVPVDKWQAIEAWAKTLLT